MEKVCWNDKFRMNSIDGDRKLSPLESFEDSRRRKPLTAKLEASRSLPIGGLVRAPELEPLSACKFGPTSLEPIKLIEMGDKFFIFYG